MKIAALAGTSYEYLEKWDAMNNQGINFMIDSADRQAAERWLRTGVVTGLTTNPAILKAAGQRVSDIASIYQWASDAGAREVCFQTWGLSVENQYRSAMQILEVAPGAIIKIPCTTEGAQVITRLRKNDVPILMTAIYASKQALIASALGVKYIAPYFNRMLRAGRNAVAEISQMIRAIPQDGAGPLIVAASLKSAHDVVTLSDIGVRFFTVSAEVLEDLFTDALTESAVLAFEEDMRGLL